MRFVMTRQVRFLLHQDPCHFGVIQLGVLVLNRFVLNRFVLSASFAGYYYLLFIRYVKSIELEYVDRPTQPAGREPRRARPTGS